MKKYAVAFISFIDMDLELVVIESTSAIDAARKFLQIAERPMCENLPWSSFSSVEALDDFLCQCEASIQVKEVV